ncbi:hypothetical protein [Bradyrhizobium sp. RT3b]|uniref:hypothetical protein n=1 Tax=Bradyrhizobium sp. RT3b TaxID=3156334 RepID=UPI0033968AB6
MTTTACPIWGTVATIIVERTGDSFHYDSPRAGGLYGISGTAKAMLQHWEPKDRARLTTWLCDQRRAGIKTPLIHSDLFTAVKSTPLLTMTERLERGMLHFRDYRIGQLLVTPRSEQFDHHDTEGMIWAAETEALTKAELVAFAHLLIDMGLLVDRTPPASSLHQFLPNAQGWLKIEELTRKLPSTTQAFVAMWFNPSVEAAYAQGIAPAIADAGYRAVRIDKKEHSNKIDDEIVAEIRRSKFLIADFTCEKEKVRGGVYFEAGFAMGLAIPVIWTVSQQSITDLHFDTRQYNHIAWDTPANLRIALRARIEAVIGAGPLKTG